MRTSWVAVSINNIKTRASSEMTSRKNIKIFYFNGVNVVKYWYVAGRGLGELPIYDSGDFVTNLGEVRGQDHTNNELRKVSVSFNTLRMSAVPITYVFDQDGTPINTEYQQHGPDSRVWRCRFLGNN